MSRALNITPTGPLSGVVLTIHPDADLPAEVKMAEWAQHVRETSQRVCRDLFELGRTLRSARELARSEGWTSGAWGHWCQEAGMGTRHARRLIRIADAFENVDLHGNARLSMRALDLLARPGNEDARDEAAQRANDGEAITPALAREIVEEHGADTVSAVAADDGELMRDAGELAKVRAADEAEAKRELGPGKDTAGDGDEWYTPEWIVERARQTMGGFDLDPASNVYANKVVKATNTYTIEDDGLSLDWYGRVLLNPPYSNTTKWVERLLNEYELGNVSEAVLIVKAKTAAYWFWPLWQHAICFVLGKVSFTPGPGVKGAGVGWTGTAVAYLGPNVERFRAAFQSIGAVVTDPHAATTQPTIKK